jgi:hypothetical protein
MSAARTADRPIKARRAALLAQAMLTGVLALLALVLAAALVMTG